MANSYQQWRKLNFRIWLFVDNYLARDLKAMQQVVKNLPWLWGVLWDRADLSIEAFTWFQKAHPIAASIDATGYWKFAGKGGKVRINFLSVFAFLLRLALSTSMRLLGFTSNGTRSRTIFQSMAALVLHCTQTLKIIFTNWQLPIERNNG